MKNSAANQTYNTPALATVFLTLQTVEWMCANGGLEWAAGRCDASADVIYGWTEASDYAEPFVGDASRRSHTVATIDIDAAVADAAWIATVLRANRHRRHRVLPGAGPQPTPYRALSRHPSRGRSRSVRLHRPHRRPAVATVRPFGAVQREGAG